MLHLDKAKLPGGGGRGVSMPFPYPPPTGEDDGEGTERDEQLFELSAGRGTSLSGAGSYDHSNHVVLAGLDCAGVASLAQTGKVRTLMDAQRLHHRAGAAIAQKRKNESCISGVLIHESCRNVNTGALIEDCLVVA